MEGETKSSQSAGKSSPSSGKKYQAFVNRTMTTQEVERLEANIINAWNDPANQLNAGSGGSTMLTKENFGFLRNSILMHFALNGASQGTEITRPFTCFGIEYDPQVVVDMITRPRRWGRYYSNYLMDFIKGDEQARKDMADAHAVSPLYAHLVFDFFDSYSKCTADEKIFVARRKDTKVSGEANNFTDVVGDVKRQTMKAAQPVVVAGDHQFEDY